MDNDNIPGKNSVIVNELKIIAINANSIVTNQKRANLFELVNRNHPDLVLIGETKLNDRNKVSFQNYTIIRTDRLNSKRGGGTAVLIKKPIKFERILPLCLDEGSCLEATIVKIKMPRNQSLFIIAAYAAGKKITKFISNLTDLFAELKLDSANNYFILAGDLNAKHTSWQNYNDNGRGIALYNWLSNNLIRYKVALFGSSLPTFPRGNSFLDICLADNRLDLADLAEDGKLETISYDSDHNGIKFSISLNRTMILETQENPIKFNWTKTDWNKFTKFVEKNTTLTLPSDRNLSIQEIDDSIKYLEDLIKRTVEANVPKFKSIDQIEKYLNPEIKNLQKYKSFLLTQINRIYRSGNAGSNNFLSIYKGLLKDTKNKLENEFKQSVSAYWEQQIRSVQINDSMDMFPQVNRLFRQKGCSPIDTLKIPETKAVLLTNADIDFGEIPKDNSNRFVISRPAEKLKIIGAHFASANIQNRHLGKEGLSNIINNFADLLKTEIREDRTNMNTVTTFSQNNYSFAPTVENIPNYFVSVIKLRKIFKHLNNKKSSGFDNIPNIVLKHLPIKIIVLYTILFNNALNNMYFPMSWKRAKVIALKKPGKDGSDPSSYRPICLLSNIGKVYETVINISIEMICKVNGIIPEYQFGFRHKHSTIHAINKFTSDICWAMNDKKCVGACFIDLEKAFDTVWLDGLFFKLKKKNFPSHLIKLIWDMLHDKNFMVTDGILTSDKTFEVLEGLQQGTVNSPILFNIFTCDLLKSFRLNEDPTLRAIAYADDLLIYVIDENPIIIQDKLQELFEKIQFYFHSWKLKINTSKCETILFRPKLQDLKSHARKSINNFTIREAKDQGEKVPHKEAVKYLGLLLDNKLKYKVHVNNQLAKAKKAFMSASKLFESKYLCSKIKLLCYLTLIRPIVSYGCQIWWNTNAMQMEKIRKFERRCLRKCLGMQRSRESDFKKHCRNENLLNAANIMRIDNFMIKLIRKHCARASSTTDINNLINGPFFNQDRYFKKCLKSGHVPPEAFIYADAKGYIQDQNNVPLIYHIKRGRDQYAFTYQPNIICVQNEALCRFNMKLSNRDIKDKHRKNHKKFWWLSQ